MRVPRRFGLGEPFVDIEPEGQRIGMESIGLEPRADPGNGRFLGDRGKGIGRRMRWLGWVLAGRPAHVVKRFRQPVPGFEFFVGEGPRGGYALAMAKLGKVLSAVA